MKPESAQWWKRYFVEFADEYLRRYKRLLDERAEKEAFFLHGLLSYLEYKNNDRYRKILDAPCGYGRISKVLARIGYDVTGVDISEKFIDIARTECKQCKFMVADLRELPFENESFDVVLNIFTSFGYFDTDEENEKVIKEASRVLRIGGLFILELINGNYVRLNFEPVDVDDDEEYLTIVRRELQWPRLREHYFTFRKRGKDLFEGLQPFLRYNIVLRLYTQEELENLGKKYDLVPLMSLESWSMNPAKQSSKRLMIIYMKI
jgi:SAM-dependent methyltransferase